MSDSLSSIAALTEERRQLYSTGRWLTSAEQQRAVEITAALKTLWEQRRQELATLPTREHELTVVARLKEPFDRLRRDRTV